MYIPNPLCHHHFARTKVSKLKYSKAAISTKQPVEWLNHQRTIGTGRWGKRPQNTQIPPIGGAKATKRYWHLNPGLNPNTKTLALNPNQ